MLLAAQELKTIADQLVHSSVVLTADTCHSVAGELGLKTAAAAGPERGQEPAGGRQRPKTQCPRAKLPLRRKVSGRSACRCPGLRQRHDNPLQLRRVRVLARLGVTG
jgi:hypothetical protein